MPNSPFVILIIDDEWRNLKLLEAILKREGYSILTATSGPEGRQLARKKQPDLILLDIIMPEESGFETCQVLQEDPVTSDIPIIFLSALDDVASKVKGLNLGGVDYLTKPYQREEVLARVRNHLKLRLAYRRIIEEQSLRLQQLKQAQKAILVQPHEIPRAQFGVKYIPILEAGGDFYDVFDLGKEIFAYFAADISGHDIGASFATSALKALIRQNSNPLLKPSETMRMINKILVSIFKEGKHLTCVYAVLNRKQGKLHLVNAGHPPVILIGNDKASQLIETSGDIVGAFEQAIYKDVTIDVQAKDRLFFYSDGLVESFCQKGQTREAGIQTLLAACQKYSALDIEQAVEKIIAKLRTKTTPEDDMLLLGVDI